MTTPPTNGHPQQMKLVPITLLIPATARDVQVVRVLARWKSSGGIQLGTKEVQVIPGLVAEAIMTNAAKLMNEGVLQRKVLDPETRKPLLDPETQQPQLERIHDLHLVLVRPEQPPPKRILPV